MSQHLYSIQALKELSDNNEIFIREMIELFVSNSRTLLLDLEASIARKDSIRINKLAHSIKPNMNTYCISGAAEKLNFLEMETLSQVRWELVKQTFEEVRVQILEAISQMEKDYNLS